MHFYLIAYCREVLYRQRAIEQSFPLRISRKLAIYSITGHIKIHLSRRSINRKFLCSKNFVLVKKQRSKSCYTN